MKQLVCPSISEWINTLDTSIQKNVIQQQKEMSYHIDHEKTEESRMHIAKSKSQSENVTRCTISCCQGA